MNEQGMKIIVTTSLRAGVELLGLADRISAEIGVPRVRRGNLSLDALLSHYGAHGVIVVETKRVFYTNGSIEFFFHPGLAVLRIAEIRKGKNDQMIAAMNLKPGQQVLDCTLGLGNDALVAGYVTGENGLVLGLESSPVIAALVRHGLHTYNRTSRAVQDVMRRIKVNCADHRDVLENLPANSFDVVYLDPMFRNPLIKSNGINSLRPLADRRPLTPEVTALAFSVARKRVVVKDIRWGNRLQDLGFSLVTGGKSSPVLYGILNKES